MNSKGNPKTKIISKGKSKKRLDQRKETIIMGKHQKVLYYGRLLTQLVKQARVLRHTSKLTYSELKSIVIKEHSKITEPKSLYEKYQSRYTSLLSEVNKFGQLRKKVWENTKQNRIENNRTGKKNGLTQLPNKGKNNNFSIFDKKSTDIAMRSAVMLRRMEYNEKIANKQAQKDPIMVIMIQRYWRRYYTMEIIKNVKKIQKRFKRYQKKKIILRKLKADKFKSIIYYFCYHKYFEYACFKIKQKGNRCKKKVQIQKKSNIKTTKPENPVAKCENENKLAIKNFPRHKQEISADDLVNLANILKENNLMNESNITSDNGFYNNSNQDYSFISNSYLNTIKSLSHFINRKVTNSRWVYFSHVLILKDLIKIKLIQKVYRKRLMSRDSYLKKGCLFTYFAKLISKPMYKKSSLLYEKYFFDRIKTIPKKKKKSTKNRSKVIYQSKKPIVLVKKIKEKKKNLSLSALPKDDEFDFGNKRYKIFLKSIQINAFTQFYCKSNFAKKNLSSETTATFNPMISKEVIDDTSIEDYIFSDAED